jgi:hypothetical protein
MQTNCRNGADEVRRTGEFDELEFDELGSSTNWGVRRTGEFNELEFDELGFDEVSFYG